MDDAMFRDLWQGWQANDGRAKQELADYCMAQLYKYVARRLPCSIKNETSPESITHNVIVNLLKAQHNISFPTFGAFWAFLLVAARNALIDAYHKTHTQKNDIDRKQGGDAIQALLSDQVTPSKLFPLLELYEEVRWRFTPEVWIRADQVAARKTWPEIAKNDRSEQDRLRNLLKNAFDSVAEEFAADLELPDDDARSIALSEVRADRLQNLYKWVVEQGVAKDQHTTEVEARWQQLHDETLPYLTSSEEAIARQRVQGLSWKVIAQTVNNPFTTWRQAFIRVSQALGSASPLLVKSAYEWIEWQKTRQP